MSAKTAPQSLPSRFFLYSSVPMGCRTECGMTEKGCGIPEKPRCDGKDSVWQKRMLGMAKKDVACRKSLGVMEMDAAYRKSLGVPEKIRYDRKGCLVWQKRRSMPEKPRCAGKDSV